jgi:hypothetical protein
LLYDCVRLGADLEQRRPQGSYRHAGLCSHTRAAMESRRKAGRRVGEVGRRKAGRRVGEVGRRKAGRRVGEVGRRRVKEAGQEH